MPLHIPSKLIIFISTIVSTAISLLAGYLLYAESVAVLRSAVDDTSAATSHSAKLRLAGMLSDVETMTEEGHLLFNREDVMNISLGIPHIQNIFGAHAFASLRPTLYDNGGGYYLARAYNPSCTSGLNCPWDSEEYSRQFIWFDPILDNNGEPAKYWVRSKYSGRRVNSTKVEFFKQFTALNNETGVPAPEVLNSEKVYDSQEGFVKNMAGIPTTGVWSPAYFWNAIDGTPYASTQYRIRYTLRWPQGDFDLVVGRFFIFPTWTPVIREFEAPNVELVVLDSGAGQVYAHTLYEGPVIKFECYTMCFSCSGAQQGQDCVLHPSDLGPTVSEAVNASVVRPNGTFFTADLSSTNMRTHIRYGEHFAASDVNKTNPMYKKDYHVDTALEGGEYFLRMTHVFTASTMRFELLWMRTVSSVNDKVYAALVQLIIASVVIFMVDIVIALCEVMLISRPLERLAVGSKFLETMELNGAEAHMNAMYKPVMVKEVARVTDGLQHAIKGLREYKAYLPNTLFVDTSDDSENKSKYSDTSNSTSMSKTTHHTATAMAGQNLSMQLQSYKGTVVRLAFASANTSTGFPEAFGTLVETMHEIAQATRGIAHGFAVSDPFVFTLTWNVGLRCTDPMSRAVAFCRSIVSSQKMKAIAMPNMAVAHGGFVAGNLGSSANKGFGMKGAPLMELRGISSVSNVMSTKLRRPLTLVSPTVAEGVTGKYEVAAVTLLVVDEMKKPFVVHEIGQEMTVREEEWMYQLDEAVDPVAVALREVVLDPKAAPSISIEHPTDTQRWSMMNIRDGNAVMRFCSEAVHCRMESV